MNGKQLELPLSCLSSVLPTARYRNVDSQGVKFLYGQRNLRVQEFLVMIRHSVEGGSLRRSKRIGLATKGRRRNSRFR